MAPASEVLFTVTSAHLNTGLRGVPVGTCRTSRVDPEEGVSYRGYAIADLADLDPEAVIHLLFHGELPDAAALQGLRSELASRAELPAHVVAGLASLPADGHPMEWLVTGLMLLGMGGTPGDVYEDALTAIAKTPALIAAIYRMRSGWGDPIPARHDLGLVENFVHMLGVPGGRAEQLVPLLRTFYVLHMDHGGGNLSTFTGKAVASGGAHMYASLASSMAALSGPLHGGANQACLDFVKKVGSPDPAHVESFVRGALERKEKIFGFGHGVLRAEDPRAAIQYALGEQLCPEDDLFRTAVTMREVVPRILGEVPKISNPYPNVDAVSGTLLHAAGLTDSDYYTTLFGLARVAGIAAQIVHERTDLRDGRPVPIYRPKYLAVDQPSRSA